MEVPAKDLSKVTIGKLEYVKFEQFWVCLNEVHLENLYERLWFRRVYKIIFEAEGGDAAVGFHLSRVKMGIYECF